MTTVRIWAGAVVLIFTASTAYAQPRLDVAATFGGLTSRVPSEGAGYHEDWFATGLAGMQLGWYVTPHVKLDVEAFWTSEGTQFLQRFITVPGVPYPVPVTAEARSSVRSVGTAVTWQFRDNEWVHPFVQAGVSTDFERRSIHTWEQRFFPNQPRGTPPIVEERVEGPSTRTALRLLVGAGTKLYVTPRLFVRADTRVTVGRTRQDVALRAGLGIDF